MQNDEIKKEKLIKNQGKKIRHLKETLSKKYQS
jgi:hypothetical protein